MRMLTLCLLLAVLLGGCKSVPEQIGKCPQPRFTGKAPAEFYQQDNPLAATADNIKAGKKLYQHETPGRIACARCHGRDGDGVGPMSHMFEPPPRNFTCAQTIKDVPDGQLFWIVRNGSPGTSMPAFDKLDDEQIWQVILYIRRLANAQYDS